MQDKSVGQSSDTSKSLKVSKFGRSLLCSPIWKWFEEIYVDNIWHSQYNVEMANKKPCDTKVKTGNSTTALWKHLKIEYGYSGKTKQQLNKKQTTITKAFEASLSKPHSITEQAICDRAIIETMPSRGKVKSLIDERFEQICYRITITWINKMFELNKAVLAVTSLKYLHTTDAIAKYIKDVLEHWNLKSRVFSITTDSEVNIKSACNKLDIKWVSCSAYILNLIVQKRLLPAKPLITQMKYLIKFFTTPKQSECLEAVQLSIQAQH
ncbi:7994_t:CDS:2 [Dentiscutata heterogama]|uniref:7994_t:CDS:1 n=1 Tax=Dentiscutata heterogama TaxID=1316150 RepID=A0ACA9MLS8_9GLOM|nr:7994_t:CDS:2 [Dentiscutata heterogama]